MNNGAGARCCTVEARGGGTTDPVTTEILSREFLALGPFRSPYNCASLDDLLRNHTAPSSVLCQHPRSGAEIAYDPAQAASSGYLAGAPRGPGGSPVVDDSLRGSFLLPVVNFELGGVVATRVQITRGSNDTAPFLYLEEVEVLTVLDCAEQAPFIRGDADRSGSLNLTDAVFTLSWLFQGGVLPGCRAALDASGDGVINLTDVVGVLGYLFQGGPEPVAPFAACGPGALPSDGVLGCLESPQQCP